MKRISLLALAMAVAVIVSCSKAVAPQNEDTTPGEPIAFEAGQEVTLTIGTGIGTGTFTDTASSDVLATAAGSISGIDANAKSRAGIVEVMAGDITTSWDSDDAPATRVTNTFNASSGISFAWETGDQIKVTVGDKSSIFTLAGTAGSATATFKGNMPAAGTEFSVQYPVTDITDADLATQTYVAGGVQKDKIQFSATGCTLSSGAISLTAVQSVLRLNFYGTSVTLDSIVVTKTSPSPSVKYKLDCSAPSVAIGSSSSAATPFLLVLPAVSDISFTAQAYPHGSGPVVTKIDYVDEYGINRGKGISIPNGTSQSSFSTTSKNLTANQVLNMASNEISTSGVDIWAPVNCGYCLPEDNEDLEYGYPVGKYYQWGRKVGGGYTVDLDESRQQYIKASDYWTDNGCNTSPADKYFYAWPSESTTHELFDWYTSTKDKFFLTWPMKPTDTGYVAGKIDNPCPSGWRVPTSNELGRLCYTDFNTSTLSGSTKRGTWDNTNKGWNFGEGLFLPAAGYRAYLSGISTERGVEGRYWASIAADEPSQIPVAFFTKDSFGLGSSLRAQGFSVRCVQE